METKVNLTIAGITVQLRSRFPLIDCRREEIQSFGFCRLKNFLYRKDSNCDITIRVRVVRRLPEITGGKKIFITRHFQDKSENWRWTEHGSMYVYQCTLEGKEQLMLVDRSFTRVSAYVLPKEGNREVWSVLDIVYDFLQILLINYLALYNKGIITHSVAVRDTDGSGLLFCGKSGAGKTTTARLWHRYSRALVLNDDRVIVRKSNNGFSIHGSPWHGGFNDYLASRLEEARLTRIFFLYHGKKNTARTDVFYFNMRIFLEGQNTL